MRKLQTNAQAMLTVLSQWYSRLPAAQQDLFGGLVVGWETGIGANAYYYPNGNAIEEQCVWESRELGMTLTYIGVPNTEVGGAGRARAG